MGTLIIITQDRQSIFNCDSNVRHIGTKASSDEICIDFQNKEFGILGYYNSKERIGEILTDIADEWKNNGCSVYEMPEE